MNNGLMTPAELAARRQEELDHLQARREWIIAQQRARRAARVPDRRAAVVVVCIVAVAVVALAWSAWIGGACAALAACVVGAAWGEE